MAPGGGGCEIKLVFDFGMHTGRQIYEVDEGYLHWIVSKFPEADSWSKAAATALPRGKMHKEQPNVRDLLSDLKSCTTRRDLQKGRRAHTSAVESGMDSSIYVANALIYMYAKCGSIEVARTVFDSIQDPSVVSWNCLIMGYADNGHCLVSLDLFSRMKDTGRYAPNSGTYVAVLKACTLLATNGSEARKIACLEKGKEIHSEIGRYMDQFVQSTLINLYAKCGSMEDARTLFNSILEPDVVTWTNLILGYADNGQGSMALDLFDRMKDEGRCAPNSFIYVAALKACTLLAANGSEGGKRVCLERGKCIHSEIGGHMDRFMQSTLINLYAKCGSMQDARAVFDSMQKPSVVSWNCLILGYAVNGQGYVALGLFSRMKMEGKCAPDSLTYLAALMACTSLAEEGSEAEKRECLERGRQIHSQIGPYMDKFLQNTLINLYAKCGSMVDARTVFESMKQPNVVSWTALILGYVGNEQGHVALDLFSRMEDEGKCAPNSFTYVAALMACCSVGALAMGRRIHLVITKFDPQVVTCLVDFYAKCGSMEEAREVFDLHPQARDVSTWTALLAGYAQFGDTGSVFSLFEAMQDQGFKPDSVTFLCVLSCCSHAGLEGKAWEYLEVMPRRYGITPTVMHFSCMIDLLGRANKLDEASALLQKMGCDPDSVTWTALLGACRKWKNAEIGSWAFKSLMDLDQKQAPTYVLMAEIFGSRGMLEEQQSVLEASMQSRACAKAHVNNG